MTSNTVILNSLEAVENCLQRNGPEEAGIETLAIDWLDLENDDIRNGLQRLFLGPNDNISCGRKQWSSIEVRKCMGHLTPMLIRWILQASVTFPIDTLTLVSVVDNDVALALQQSLSGHFPNADGSAPDHNDANPQVPNVGNIEIWGSALSELSIQLIMRGIYGHASIVCSSPSTLTEPIHTLSLSNCNFLPNAVNRMGKELKVRSRTCDNVRCQTEDCALKRLSFFSCRLSDDEVATLVNALHKYKHPLKYLDLGKNRCHHATFRALGYWLGSPHCKLESLNLSLQQLGFGVQHWNPKFLLDNLIPSGNDDDGEIHMPPLKALYLRGNPIDDGVESMGDGTDALSQSFATSLVNVLTQNTTLEKVMLTDCSLSNESYDMLLQQLYSFRGIRKLWLDGIQRYQNLPKRGFTRKIARRLMGPENQNFALEELHLPFRLTDLVMQISTFMDANFGGRRLLVQEESPTKGVPPSLWPLVLERINSADLPRRLPSSKPPRFQSAGKWPGDDSGISRDQRNLQRRATILYSMIRENASLQHAIGRRGEIHR